MTAPVIGITGGIASGKSTVARLFAELGAVVVNADELAHIALQSEEVKADVRRQWGAGVFAENGQVDRAALGKVVFDDPRQLVTLEGLIHPLVREMIATALAAHAASGTSVVLDVPLLLESDHYEAICQCVVYVHASPASRQARAELRGWTEAELERREAQQLSPDEKARRADYIVDNDADMDATRTRVSEIWNRVQEGQRV